MRAGIDTHFEFLTMFDVYAIILHSNSLFQDDFHVCVFASVMRKIPEKGRDMCRSSLKTLEGVLKQEPFLNVKTGVLPAALLLSGI